MDICKHESRDSNECFQQFSEALDRFRSRLVTSWDETELIERGQEQAKRLLAEYNHAIVEQANLDELRTDSED